MKVRSHARSALVRALTLAESGFYVFPLRAGTKDGHVNNGWPDSTRDADAIRALWAAHPDANIGIACKPSGIVVIDPDAPHEVTDRATGEVHLTADGRSAWAALATQHGWPARGDVTTPRGGWHLYFRDPFGLGHSTGALAPGIDVRGSGGQHGGYVLAPGSEVGGRTYDGELRPVADLPEVPAALVALLQPGARTRQSSEPLGTRGQAAALIRECIAVRDAEPGRRNEQLNKAAFNLGQLVGAELSERLVRDSLREVAQDVGLEADEIDRTIESGLTGGIDRPRAVASLETERESKVEERLDWLRIQAEAQRRFTIESRPPAQPVEVPTLAQVLALPPEPPMRIQGLIPSDSFTAIIAAAKTGKTTFVLNLVQSLLTGRPFLGTFPVQAVTGRVAMLNYEVSNRQLARWADEIGINHDRFLPVPLRGISNPLGADHARADLAARLKAAEVESLIVDPFGRAFTGENENQTGEVGRFLSDLLQFAVEAVGARDLIMTAHTGHDTERVRGNSRLLGDPDSLITLVRNEDGERFLHAVGRDVEVTEDRLDYDEPNRRLVKAGVGSRQAVKKQAKSAGMDGHLDQLAAQVVGVVRRSPGLGTKEILDRLRDAQVRFHDSDLPKAIRRAQAEGLLRVVDQGPGRKKPCYPAEPPPTPAEPLPGMGSGTPLPPTPKGAAGVVGGPAALLPPGRGRAEDQ